MLVHAIVGRFLGNDDIMNVRFPEALRRNPYELGPGPQVVDVARAAVAHAALQAPDELVDRLRKRAAVRDAAFDAFGNELVFALDVGLEVAVLRALPHRAERSHAAVDLVAPPLVEDDLARRLVGSGKERADHDGMGAGGNRL